MLQAQRIGTAAQWRGNLRWVAIGRAGAGEADFGFTFRAGPDTDLAFEPIITDPYCLVMPPNHPLTKQKQVEWTELKRQRLITAGQQSGNMRLLERALHGIDWRPETAYEIDHLTTSLGLVTAGLGIAVLHVAVLQFGSSVGLCCALATCIMWNLALWQIGRRKVSKV